MTLAALNAWAGRSYGAEQGRADLRESLCSRYYAQYGRQPDEIFVSDGSKCDIGRLQVQTGHSKHDPCPTSAVQQQACLYCSESQPIPD